MSWLPMLVKASYFAAALLFILGIKRMASPVTARSGIQWAGAGMVVATVANTMPMPAHWMPLRAVTGEAMRLMPRMNSSAATK